jgi:hypothetical protein
MDETWLSRDLCVLDAVVELLEGHSQGRQAQDTARQPTR